MTLTLISVLALMAISFPIAFSFGLGSMLGVAAMNLKDTFVTSVVFQSLDSFPLMAIPFFILAGDLMKSGDLSRHLINFAHALVGRLKGGLATVVVLACIFFGAISGSSVATVAAIGSVMLPQMSQYGYDRRFTTALVSASGFLGIMIPPSIPLILYGVTVGVSIGKLFLATVLPGLLLGVFYIIIILVSAKKGYIKEIKNDQPESLSEVFTDIKNKTLVSLPALFLPVLILGGIYGGIFTPTEAAAVSVVYALLAGMFIYRALNIKNIVNVFHGSAVTSAVLLVLICFAAVLGRILMMEDIPNILAKSILSHVDNYYLILVTLNIVLLILGMFMETNTIILIMAPILYPLVTEIGMDPVHFGAVLTLNLGIGLITPPFAANLFVGCRISGLTVNEVMKPMMLFLLLGALPVLILTTYVPGLCMFLPNLIYK